MKLGVLHELNQLVTLDDIVLGHKLIDVVGTGGMGKVFRAVDARGRLVALKMVAAQCPEHSEEAYARCQREVEAMSAVNNSHSSLPVIYDSGLHTVDEKSFPVISMAFYDGQDLDSFNFRTPQHIGNVMWQVLGGLEIAHAQGVLHRDVKPGNILMTWGGAAKLLDFGLARGRCLEGFTETIDSTIGTPFFMSPEQIEGSAEIGPATDIYSLGVTMYSLLTCNPVPFPGMTPVDVVQNVLNSSLPPLSRNVPSKFRGFEEEIMKFERPLRLMTAKRFCHRIGSAAEARELFEEYALWNPVLYHPKLDLNELVRLAEDTKVPDSAFTIFARQRCGNFLFLSLSFLRRLSNFEEYQHGFYLEDLTRVPAVDKRSFTIGRSTDLSDYILRMEGSANRLASKKHAELSFEEGNYFLKDLSTNGTSVSQGCSSAGPRGGFGQFYPVENSSNKGRGFLIQPGYWIKFGGDAQHEMHQFVPVEYLRSVLVKRKFYRKESESNTQVLKRPSFTR